MEFGRLVAWAEVSNTKASAPCEDKISGEFQLWKTRMGSAWIPLQKHRALRLFVR